MSSRTPPSGKPASPKFATGGDASVGLFFVTEPVPRRLLGALSDLRESLDDAGFPPMIVGGVATSILGRPRATRESPEGRGAQIPDRPVSNKSLQPAGRHADFGQFIPITR